MTIHDDLERQLASWFEAEATDVGAASVLEQTLAVTARRRPRAAWAASIDGARPARLLPIDDRTRTRLSYAALLAAAIALLVAAALFLAGQRPPAPAPPLGCVGDPPNLCGYGAGQWSSSTLLPGLEVTLPGTGWYTRELPDRVEFKHLPMTSGLTFMLDPIPASTAAADRSFDGLVAFLSQQPQARLARSRSSQTATGLPIRVFDLTRPRPAVVLLRLAADPDSDINVEANHYANRVYLVDIGRGRALAALVTAFDSQRATLRGFDDAVWPIIDSIRPPASTKP